MDSDHCISSPPQMADVEQRQRAHRSPSSDSVSSLRSRTSAFMRLYDRSTSPIPELPPQRPLRNPARTSIVHPPPLSRPSSSKSSRADITPWDFQSPPPPPPRVRSGAPSIRSKASSKGLGHAYTGPAEEVTPWELFPVPDTVPSPSLSNPISVHSPDAPSPRTLYPAKPTGLVEEVTPWELYPDPASPIASPSSKPASVLGHSSLKSYRESTATGPTEEVTPWELQPPHTIDQPAASEKVLIQSAQQRNSLSMSKALLEEVTPWELYSPPPVPVVEGGSVNATLKKGNASRSNTSSTSKHLVDFRLVRRRRSSGSRASKSRSQSNPAKAQSRINSSQAISNHTPEWAPVHPSQSEQATKQMRSRFSTADRTILEQLKRNIRGREAQFAVKGVGDGSLSRGKRHHPYSIRDVPYPRSYDREVVDLDVWETLFCQEICASLTWHVFDEPPLKVLDMGCGTGTWILNCARTWRHTQFVGLDIVPLQPDLQQVGSIDYASRITWVQANFLQGLPFPNDEFDFVHVKRIALGVPEDKWDALFDEISRVMKPGAAFEMVEEDLFFPGKQVENEEENYSAYPLSRSNSIPSVGGRSNLSSEPLDCIPQVGQLGMALTPTLGTLEFHKAPSRPGSPQSNTRVSFSLEERTDDIRNHAGSTTPPGSPRGYVVFVSPHSQSSARPTLYVRTSRNAAFCFASTNPPKSNRSSLFTDSAVSLINSLAQHSPESDHRAFRRRRSSTNLSSLHDSNTQATSLLSSQASSEPSVESHSNAVRPSSINTETSKTTPFLLRTPAKPPANPRDHSLLEYIYYETLSSRFINTSPLSLLTTYLEYHFKDARTHPPILYTFPPVPVKADVESDSDTEDMDDDGSHHPEKKERGLPKSATPSQRSGLSYGNGEFLEEHRWLSMQGLLHQSSPYVSLDESQSYGLSPAANATSKLAGKDTKASRTGGSRLPNKTLNIDLRTLNLHLALRAKEVLACSESMWEWIQESQNSRLNEREAQRRNGRQSVDMYGEQPPLAPSNKSIVAEMTREDFNQLLLNFEMDMQDQASLHTALKERFGWNAIDSAPPQHRKIFNTACEKYAKWLRKEHRASISSSIRPSRSSLHAPRNINVITPTPDTPFSSERALHTIFMNRNKHISPLTTPQKSDASVHFAEPCTAAPASLPPTQKLSRSMSVFVAWKPDVAPSTKA